VLVPLHNILVLVPLCLLPIIYAVHNSPFGLFHHFLQWALVNGKVKKDCNLSKAVTASPIDRGFGEWPGQTQRLV
jgi:hypothetical protein